MNRRIKQKKSKQVDMLRGSLADKIILFALPLAASSILQQLFNSADVAVAGRFAGSEALAAVGGNSPVINLIVNLFVGFSIGANVVIANAIGQGNKKKANRAAHTVISLAIICGIALIFIGNAVAAPILSMMDTPDNVLPLAVEYLRIYFCGMPFFMVYNFGSAVLRSIGDTKKPLYCLLVSGVINVALNLFLVIVCDLGVAGVAIATVTANAISASMIIFFLIHADETIRLDIKKLSLNKDEVINIVKIGAPAGLQGMVFSLSNVCIQAGINSFGTAGIAGSAAAVNYEFFTYFVTSAFTQACITFTSQNYGAKQYDRCKKILRVSLALAMVCTACMSIVFVLGKEFFIGIYTTDKDAMVYGVARLIRVGLLTALPPLYEVTGGALRGIGHSMTPAVLTVFGSCVLRIVWINTIFKMFSSFEILMAVYPFTWVVTSLLVIGTYFIVRKKEYV